jgi:hypothetical protein
MVGGIFASFILELLVYPAIYAVWRQRTLRNQPGALETSIPAYEELEAERSELVTLQLQRQSR